MQLGDVDKYLAKLDAETAKLAELDLAAATLSTVITTKGVNLPALVEKASSLSAQRAEVTSEIEILRKLIAEHSGSLFDTSFADALVPVLYERSENAKEQRAKANLVLRRLIDKVELIASDEHVVVTFKDSDARPVIIVAKLSTDTPIRTTEDDDTPVPVNPLAPALPGFVPDEATARRLRSFLKGE